MINEKKRHITCMFIGMFFGFVVCSAIWGVTDYIRKRTISNGMFKYADRTESAQELTDSTETGLEELAEQMQRTGDTVAECSTDVAELRDYSDRITETNKEIEDSAGRIEASVYRIMQLIDPG